MRNILSFARRWMITPALIVAQIFATSILLLAAPQDYSDQQGSSYDPSQSAGQQDYGYPQSGSQQPSTDSIAAAMCGPGRWVRMRAAWRGRFWRRAVCRKSTATTNSIEPGGLRFKLAAIRMFTATAIDLSLLPSSSVLFTTQSDRRLTIFGSNLFANVPTTFSPLDRAPVPADYVIGPGDELLIRGWGQVDINVQGAGRSVWEHLYPQGRRSRSYGC